ncbi:hypothetical protein BD311DRAFT_678809, partial [Dichomitus squalens]
DGATYIPLTTKYPHLTTQGQASKENVRPKRIIASVNEESPEVEPTTIAAIAAVGSSPLAHTTGILGTGSDSDESCVPPLFAPQTFLRARLVPDPDAPVFDMLIDGGAGPVLVRRDVAVSIGVPLRRLPTAHRLGDAWGKVSEGMRSEEWVKLRVLLPDLSWSSRVCRAIVVDNLCAPVILGKTWLESNSIVEDHAAHTLLNKSTGRDLLSPPPLPTPPQRTPPPQRLAADTTVPDTTSLTISAVCAHVECLALLETLDRENTAMKTTFSDQFPSDIPHIDQLPSDVHHRFILKDANLVIARRQYNCPKKYREVWKSLLDEHIAAG